MNKDLIKQNLLLVLSKEYKIILNRIENALRIENNNFFRSIQNREKELILKDLEIIETSNIDKLVALLCNEQLTSIKGLDERKTYILRKRLGIFDNGKMQTYDEISKILDARTTSSNIGKMLNDIYRDIINDIKYNVFISNCLNMPYDDMLKIRLNDDSFPDKFIKLKHDSNIKTIKDVIEKSSNYYKWYFNCKLGEEFIKFIHELGLLFANENYDLTSKDSILRKDVEVLCIPFKLINNLHDNRIKTISDLINLESKTLYNFKCHKKRIDGLIEEIHELGLYFKDERDVINYYLEQIQEQTRTDVKIKKLKK